jgi:Transposase IS66 family
MGPFTHAISYQRLSRLFMHLFALQICDGALDAIFRRAMPCFDNEVAAILARLRRSRIICSDETTVRIDGRTHWNWVFRTSRWSFTSSATAALPAWWPKCSLAIDPASGFPTSGRNAFESNLKS